MLNDKICKLREELNNSIQTGKDFKEIYKLSVELDELIAKYYNENGNSKEEENEKQKNHSYDKKCDRNIG